jgi:type I restriction enzyme S subunit
MRETALGEFLRIAKDEVVLEPDETYATAGIFSYGRGLFERPLVKGAGTKYKSYFRFRAGQFVYSKLFAWEGALAVVPSQFEGFFVSQEFPTFNIDPEAAIPEFVRLLCEWSPLWERVRSGESGMGGRRKRVHPSRLLEVTVPLPLLAQQRRIVDLIAAVDASMASSAGLARHAELAYRRLAVESLENGNRLALDKAVEVTIGRQRAPQHQVGQHIVPYLRAANVKDGQLLLEDVLSMNFEPNEQATYRLSPGDVLVTEGCGSIGELGASAAWEGEIPGTVCFQNTLLRLRARPGATLPRFVLHLARYAHAVGLWASVASGTNIFHISLKRAQAMLVPVPSLEHQEQLSESLDALETVRRAAAHESARLRLLRLALVSDLLSGEHEIPESYDSPIDSAA